VPADAAAELLEPLSAEAARILRAIAYAPVVSVALGLARPQVGHPLDGFGFLAPRREGLRTLGALFSSSLFAGRAPDGRVMITVFLGGETDRQAVDLDDDRLVEVVCRDLAAALSITGEPSLVRVTRYPRAIAQYTLGHGDRIDRLDRLVAAFPGLYLRASWRDGISVADCVKNAEVLAERLV
jgi:oxygen-dependent protoporphyrinogen oxidase